MFTTDDLIDALMVHLGGRFGSGGVCGRASASPGEGPRGPSAASSALPKRAGLLREEMLPAGRRFVCDYELRKMLEPGSREVTVERGSIVSPLALEWLELEGIRVVER